MVYAQPAAKLCVGFIQTWIIVELTYHIRNATNPQISLTGEKKLRCGRMTIILITTISFVALNSIGCWSSYRPESNGIYFKKADDKVICMGLGVPDPKGVFGTTLNLQKIFGEERVFDIP